MVLDENISYPLVLGCGRYLVLTDLCSTFDLDRIKISRTFLHACHSLDTSPTLPTYTDS